MILRHMALTCSSEEKSDKFYKNLLGLRKLEPKTLSHTLSQAIFNVDSELKVINYMDEYVHFEIFITFPYNSNISQIGHVCLEVKNLEVFLGKCRSMDVEIIQVPKGDALITFVRDYDGNLFEIKD